MKRLLKRRAKPVADDSATIGRLKDPRIAGPFPASVSGVDARGEEFEISTVLDDLSASDFNLRIPRQVNPGEELVVVAQVYYAAVALRGIVLRSESINGVCGITVGINRYRFVANSKVENESGD